MSCLTIKDRAAQSLALGKGERQLWTAVLPATVVALANYHLFQLFLNPAAGTYPGVILTAQTVIGGTTPSLTSGLINFLDPAAPERSYFLEGECLPMTSPMLGELLIFDLLAYYPGLVANSLLPQPLIGAASVLPARMASGRGVHMMLDTAVALGAGASNCAITYTNRLGVGGRVTPTFALIPSSPQGRVPTARHILPLQAGDDGVQSVQIYDQTALMGAGTISICLIKPLISIPVPANFSTTSGVGQAYWFNDPLDVTEILTGAALSAIFIPSAATGSAQLGGFLKNVMLNPN